MNTSYSFRDVVATIDGPGGNIILAGGVGAAEEGISIEAVGDQSTMTIGADGSGQHSLSADTSSTVTVRLLKTSPVNFALQAMFNYQAATSSRWGRNSITVRNVAGGDLVTLTGAAFKKRVPVTYAKEAGVNEWTFDAISTSQVLGVGTPEL